MLRTAANQDSAFLSHSHLDNAWCGCFVHELAEAGFNAWYDANDLKGGDEWIHRIEKEVSARSLFVPVLTPTTWGGSDTLAGKWVRLEFQLALVSERRIVPILLAGDVENYRGFVRLFQWVDARGKSPKEAAELFLQEIQGRSEGGRHQVAGGPPVRDLPLLAELNEKGFTKRLIEAIEIIIPPVARIAASTVLVGSDPTHDRYVRPNELPRHSVPLGDFAICRYPLTVAEYECGVNAGIVREPPTVGGVSWREQTQSEERKTHPVVNISWGDVVFYAAWLAEMTRQPWRLPTEEEWEQAARGDAVEHRLFTWGNDWDRQAANLVYSHHGTTSPVGAFARDCGSYGIYDMVGNVSEWTSSTYKLYSDVLAGSVRPANQRVIKGGNWGSILESARIAVRHKSNVEALGEGLGVRLAMDK